VEIKIFDTEIKAKEVLIDGQPTLVRVDAKEVCIVRKGHQYFAFQNACPHMGEKLHQGNTNHLNEIICPLHTYRFSMQTGEESSHRCASIKIYEVAIKRDGVFLVL